MFLNFQLFAFEGQNKKFTVNIELLNGILYCDAGPGCLIRTVYKHSMLILITDIIFVIVLDAVAKLRDSYVSCIYLVELISVAQRFGYSSFCSF